MGGARTALFNWLFAKQNQGVFVLRIEDTDQNRSNPEHTEAIVQAMSWLGLDWDEGPFFQSKGVERHREDVQTLLDSGCAPTGTLQLRRILRMRGKARRCALAMLVAPVVFHDGELRPCLLVRPRNGPQAEKPTQSGFSSRRGKRSGRISFTKRCDFRIPRIDDLVLLRSDGNPTYNLAVASDDNEQRITHVIRGDDHLSNTPKQILLYRALSRPVPVSRSRADDFGIRREAVV